MNAPERKESVQNGVRRMVFAVLSIVLEVWLILSLVVRFSDSAAWIEGTTRLLAALLALGIYSQHRTASMKMPWIILILLMPVLGSAMYLLIGLNGSTWKARERYNQADREIFARLPGDDEVQERFREADPARAGISAYLKKYSGYSLYDNTDIVYYDEAYQGLEAQKSDLKRAKKFIFMEYHAIEDRESWHGLQKILEEKVREGVEVRVLYDDMGSIGFVNTDFVKRLEAVGIQCRVFNPFMPGLNVFLNNRDHRKITVIDGRVGFTGGYNLANEYFNIDPPYGHWKDTGIRLEGDAVQGLTAAFLEMWDAMAGHREPVQEQVDRDLPYLEKVEYQAQEGGFVHPYADNPMDNENVGENVYISMAEAAREYCWFITPYLILTDEMIHALGLAAKRGVDVRVITPGIPDKKLVYQVTRSYYNTLTRNGVKVYEYTPGFCHCKMSVSDDVAATCGTINLDYRSLYHHFENGCFYYGKQAVLDTKEDFVAIIAQSRDVTEYYTTGRGNFLRFGQLILRLFAPLL